MVNICKYCKNKGFNKEEYNLFKDNIKSVAEAIRSQLTYKGGMYYPTNKIIDYRTNEDIRSFIIQELKLVGIEFIKDDSYYRVVD